MTRRKEITEQFDNQNYPVLSEKSKNILNYVAIFFLIFLVIGEFLPVSDITELLRAANRDIIR